MAFAELDIFQIGNLNIVYGVVVAEAARVGVSRSLAARVGVAAASDRVGVARVGIAAAADRAGVARVAVARVVVARVGVAREAAFVPAVAAAVVRAVVRAVVPAVQRQRTVSLSASCTGTLNDCVTTLPAVHALFILIVLTM